MKIQLLSDIHIEFESFNYRETDSDVVVLAGDIHIKHHGVEWALETIKDKPVIYVLGNHEYYGKAYPKHYLDLIKKYKGTNVHILENSSVEIDGVTFLGATLWTDFKLYGDPRIAGSQCQEVMSDYKKIRVSPRYSKLRSIDVAAIHYKSLKWLEKSLAELQNNPSVVITHHGPSEKSVPQEHKNSLITSAYVSDLEATMQTFSPLLWLHGHLHNSSDYKVGDCRVVCNPRGYPRERNIDFDPSLVIEI